MIEIGVPAEHVTEIDHEMTLPTPHLRPDREWQGQRFVHNVGAEGAFDPFRLPGFEARDTTISREHQGRGRRDGRCAPRAAAALDDA